MIRPHKNKILFSNHYLNNLLPGENEWEINVEPVFEKIKSLWSLKRPELPSLNESQLRKHFLDNVFEILGFTLDVEPPAIGEEWAKKPDYAFFRDDDALKSARKKKEDGYFRTALCIGEAKRWGRPLDRKSKTEADPFEMQNPSLQMSRYLWITGVKWGILTDGKFWRLYERESSKRLDIYYEIDLEDLMLYGSLEDFKYFYLFFRSDAFPAFLDKVYKGSVDYAREVGDELKENVYKALKILSEGYLRTQGNQLSPQNLNEIHDNSLILLYRLLFILYAEYMGLLPLYENDLYSDSYSLDSLKKEIARRLDRNETIPASTFHYWNKLKELFEIINNGNKELDVPPYNGGLFDPEKHSFLERHRLGDFYIAMAIDLLSRSSDRAYIDYGSLEIRHLGSIYEGLLEYKLEIAKEDIYPVKEKGRKVYIPLNKAKGNIRKIQEEEIIKAGEIYLVTDKGERKATGSYYTPDYIVEYIVENTLGPVIEEKRRKLAEKISGLEEKRKTSRGINRDLYQKELQKVESGLIDEVLSIKILDPAMGSGHFLVEAVDFLANELIRTLSGEPLEKTEVLGVKEKMPDYGQKEPDEEDIRWARREVVEKCIFGVDLNPLAVELAKLSLWLHTVAKNRPLNFLDHHLRCGNSLIGAGIEDLAGLPELKKRKAIEGAPKQLGLFESIFKEKVNILLGAFAQIERLPSDTVEQIRQKEKLYQDFRRIVSRFQDVADIWTSVYFGNGIDFDKYQSLQDNLRANDEIWENLRNEQWFKKAKAIADEKRFFHWELEFPEVFFEGHLKKKNPGFDCVIGNPPYVSFGLGRTQTLSKYVEDFYRSHFESAEYKISTYGLFIERAIRLSKRGGHISYIVPDSFLVGMYFYKLRYFLFSNTKLNTFVVFNKDFWESGDVGFPIIFVVENHFLKDTPLQWELSHVRCDTPELLSTGKLNYIKQRQVSLLKSHRLRFQFFENSYIADLIDKIKKLSIDLDTLLSLHHGIRSKVGRDEIISKTKQSESWRKGIISSSEIHRYLLCPEVNYINVKPELLFSGGWDADHIEQTKILIRRTGDTIISVVDPYHYYHTNALIYGIPTEKWEQFSLYFGICILNSKVMDWFYRNVTMKSGRTLPQVEIDTINKFPIPRISFITPEKERKRLVEEFKEMYNKWIMKVMSVSRSEKETTKNTK